jgi:hypothetical protein
MILCNLTLNQELYKELWEFSWTAMQNQVQIKGFELDIQDSKGQ